MSPTRNTYDDAIKVLAIILVCCYHSESISGVLVIPPTSAVLSTYVAYLFISLAGMAVPLFFVVNGALLLNKPLTISKHIIKTCKVYLLLLLWCCVSFTLISVIKGDSISWSEIIRSAYTYKSGYSSYLWFLRAIVIIYVLFPIIKIAFDFPLSKWPIYCLAALFFFLSFGLMAVNNIADIVYFFTSTSSVNNHTDIFIKVHSFGLNLYPVFYFILGGLLTNNRYWGAKAVKISTCVIIFILAWLMLFGYGIIKSILDGERFDNVYECYFSLMTLTMTVSVFLIAKRLQFNNPMMNRVLYTIGGYTLGIYVLHFIVNEVIKVNFGCYGDKMEFGLPEIIFNGFTLVLISFGIAVLLKKIPLVRKIISIS
jgi:surface polysaccharide O-acyltransferase-like enzyme